MVKNCKFDIQEVQTISWETYSHQEFFLNDVLPKMKSTSFLFNSSIGQSGSWRILESSIELGNQVYVLGCFKTRANEKKVVIMDANQRTTEVVPSGGVMSHPVHPFVIADCHQEELLKRVRFGFPLMIAGAISISVGVLIAITRYF